MSHGNCIADIYKSVIADVVSNMKEAFLDENIDVDVLSQLKKEWEDKVNSSGCVDLDSNAAPPPPRQLAQSSNIRPNPNSMPSQRMNVGQPQPQNQNRQSLASLQAAQIGDAPLRVAYTQQGQPQQVQQVRLFNPSQFHGQVPFQQQLVLMQNAQGVPMSIMSNQLQQHRIFPNGQVGQQPQQGSSNQLSHMNQLDGNGALSDSNGEGSSVTVLKKREKKMKKKVHGSGASKKDAMKVLGSLLKEIQLDGGGGGMSDSSSEDDQEEDDDHDPLRTIADRLTEGAEDGDQLAEEEPLNSEDDQSDDEDLTMLFDADNVVMCQFEKVNRARTKWKFQLKDGIMHIDKKDYCFQKCSGEAEW